MANWLFTWFMGKLQKSLVVLTIWRFQPDCSEFIDCSGVQPLSVFVRRYFTWNFWEGIIWYPFHYFPCIYMHFLFLDGLRDSLQHSKFHSRRKQILSGSQGSLSVIPPPFPVPFFFLILILWVRGIDVFCHQAHHEGWIRGYIKLLLSSSTQLPSIPNSFSFFLLAWQHHNALFHSSKYPYRQFGFSLTSVVQMCSVDSMRCWKVWGTLNLVPNTGLNCILLFSRVGCSGLWRIS